MVSTVSLGRLYYRQLSPRLLLQLRLLSGGVAKELGCCGGSLNELVAVMPLGFLALLLHDNEEAVNVFLRAVERERSSNA